PEVVEAVRGLPVDAVVLDGEAIALAPDGRPRAFQVTMSRFGSRTERRIPLSVSFFDVLHVDGDDVLDLPARERHGLLAARVPEALRVPRLETPDAAAAEAFLEEALARGHEGV